MDYKKSTCERYGIWWSRCGWAVITIDENGGFNCQSDYGNYSYCWPHHGRESFKHFLIEVAKDPSYLLSKVSSRSYFNFDQSLKAWEKKLLKMQEDGDCTANHANEVMEFLRGLDEYSGSVQLVQMKILQSDIIASICDEEPLYFFETIMEYPADAMNFANVLMPMFSEILQKEMAEHGNFAPGGQIEVAAPGCDEVRWLEQDSDWLLWMCERCEYEFVLESGTPEENQINYCPQCGSKIAEYAYKD